MGWIGLFIVITSFWFVRAVLIDLLNPKHRQARQTMWHPQEHVHSVESSTVYQGHQIDRCACGQSYWHPEEA